MQTIFDVDGYNYCLLTEENSEYANIMNTLRNTWSGVSSRLDSSLRRMRRSVTSSVPIYFGNLPSTIKWSYHVSCSDWVLKTTDLKVCVGLYQFLLYAMLYFSLVYEQVCWRNLVVQWIFLSLFSPQQVIHVEAGRLNFLNCNVWSLP